MKTGKTLKRLLLVSAACAISLCLGSPALHAGVLVGTEATPSTYKVTIKKIEFQHSINGWVLFSDADVLFDLASVGPNQAVAQYAEGGTLPAGTYTAIRVTFDDTFEISASAIVGIQRLRTNTGNPATINLAGPGLTGVGLATVGVDPASEQTIPLPSGGAVPGLLAANNISIVGDGLQLLSAVNFTIAADNPVMPRVDVRFDVTNAVEFNIMNPGAIPVVIPLPPSVQITVTES